MVRKHDQVVEAIKKTRRRISKRLLKAKAEGRELEELRRIENEGAAWYTNGGKRNGRKERDAR